ncbi:hypothetical protein AMR42_02265 [Limnothrix sp. PR1529]|nr:hypothetical protein BCR12_01140 [Limnothrix sp. P13C2]PIB15320.1 hypothetical protein AMR42_02265 [Limnothrix sp. PR1529]
MRARGGSLLFGVLLRLGISVVTIFEVMNGNFLPIARIDRPLAPSAESIALRPAIPPKTDGISFFLLECLKKS